MHFKRLFHDGDRARPRREVTFDNDLGCFLDIPQDGVFGAVQETPIGKHFEEQVGFAIDEEGFEVSVFKFDLERAFRIRAGSRMLCRFR